MVIEPPAAASAAPLWPQCEHIPDGGCRGRKVEPYRACLAHLSGTERAAHLSGLAPGADLDHRGTPFTQRLLDELLAAVADPLTGLRRLGRVEFDEAGFTEDVAFDRVEFTGPAGFGGAEFTGEVCFHRSRFASELRFGEVRAAGDVRLDAVEPTASVWFSRAVIGGSLRLDVEEIGGDAVFEEISVAGDVVCDGVVFGGITRFSAADIGGQAWFGGARFRHDAGFDGVRFARPAWFDGTVFERDARFDGAAMEGAVSFDEASFERGAGFRAACIGGDIGFDGSVIGGDMIFRKAVFQRTARLGPLVFAGALDLSDAVFQAAVTIEAEARSLDCLRTRWASAAALRLRGAEVDFSDAVLEFPVTIAGRSRPFAEEHRTAAERAGSGDAPVRVTSLRGVDAAHLVLADVDLTSCLFAEAVHLDQLRLEGRCVLPSSPSGLRRNGRLPTRWTRRRTLAEEHRWRATRRSGDGWTSAPEGADVPDPAVLAPVYRRLRKSLEDGKNEPGAADFYYGEMEMRRHDRGTPGGERTLLTLYWALSGYGLRAARALGWLLLTMTATLLAIMVWGLPQDDPKQVSHGTIVGGVITMTTGKPDPVNPHGPWTRRLTSERFEKSLRVIVNSVVFRASGQDLTTAGTYVEMGSRLVEPALLALAVLAVRGRLKR
ncbi:hypothetical protein GCM10022221_08570 [Actinocorallia aurea]